MGAQQRWVMVCDHCFVVDPCVFSRRSEDDLKEQALAAGWRRAIASKFAAEKQKGRWLCRACWEAT